MLECIQDAMLGTVDHLQKEVLLPLGSEFWAELSRGRLV